MSVNDHKYSLCNVPEKWRPHLPSCRSHDYHFLPRLQKCDVSALVMRQKNGGYFILTVYNKASVNNAGCLEERVNVPFPGCTQLAHWLEVTRSDEWDAAEPAAWTRTCMGPLHENQYLWDILQTQQNPASSPLFLLISLRGYSNDETNICDSNFPRVTTRICKENVRTFSL